MSATDNAEESEQLDLPDFVAHLLNQVASAGTRQWLSSDTSLGHKIVREAAVCTGLVSVDGSERDELVSLINKRAEDIYDCLTRAEAGDLLTSEDLGFLDHPRSATSQLSKSKLTAQRMRELFAQLDASTEPGAGHQPSRELAESKRPQVFREFLWRMHNHPSPEVRYWSCYWLIWERTPSAEFIEVLERQDEYPEIRAQAAEGLANALECHPRHFAWFRRAEAALIKALDDPSVHVRWWSSFALGSARSKKSIPKLRELAAHDHTMLPGWWTVAEEAEDSLLRIARKNTTDRVPTGHNVWSWGKRSP